MSTYRVGIGHNIALGSLAIINPQPTSRGVQVARRTYGLDATVVEEGRYIELVFGVLEQPSDYLALLAQFGLSASVAKSNVTVYAPNAVWGFARYNGVAIRPEVGAGVTWENYFLRNVVILVRDLTPIT